MSSGARSEDEKTGGSKRSSVGWKLIDFIRGGGLVAIVLFMVAVVLAGSSVGSAPSPEEAAARLAAESLVSDGDFVFSAEDENRMRLRGWPEGIRPPMVIDSSGKVSFDGPWFYPLLLAPLQAVFGRFGPVLLNGILFALALVVANRSLSARSGERGVWLTTACLFGSVLVAYFAASLPVALLVWATATALALFTTSETNALADDIPDLYQEQRPVRHQLLRFALAGVFVGVVAAHDPVYMLLLLVPLALVERSEWPSAIGAAAAGAVLVLVACWLTMGLWNDLGVLPESGQIVEVSVGRGPTGVERSEIMEGDRDLLLPLRSLGLSGWNLAYALVGRHVGILPYFLPILLLVGGWRPDFGRGLLLVIAAAGLVLSFLLRPFDFAGLPSAIGNRAFIPFFVMLWWLPTRHVGRMKGLTMIALSAVILWPLWSAGSSPLESLRQGAFPSGSLFERLPYETTQRDLPVRGEVVTRDLLIRPQAGLDTAGRRGHFVLPKGRQGELVVASARSVRRLEMVFDSSASSSLEITGGEVGSMTLTPDGGVSFEIRLPDGLVRHPVWWSEDEYTFNRLRFRMPDARGSTVFSLGSAR